MQIKTSCKSLIILSIFLLSSQIVKSQSKIEELKKSVKDLSQPNKQFGLTENQEWANKIQTMTQ